MGAVAGLGTTFNLPNFVGQLFRVTPTETPFLSIVGGVSGGAGTTSKQFTWQSVDNNAPEQPQIVEGADPVYENRSRSEFLNTTQIFQYGWQLTYTKQAAVGNLDGESIIGTQPVQNEKAFQTSLKLERAARDVDFSFLNGVFTYPSDNATGRRTRGIVTATTTNNVAAAGADVDKDMFDTMVRTAVDNGAPLRSPVLFANSWNRQRVSSIYGYAPTDRSYGGLSIKTVETDFAVFGVVYERQLPAATLLLADVSVVRPRFLTIPGKGHFFVEPLAKTGAADNWQLYGEVGLEYGPENWHAKITGTSTGP